MTAALPTLYGENHMTEENNTEKLGRFGHHPDPAVDFCIEVECIQGEAENLKIGFTNGTPTKEELCERIARAMAFRVGGDEGAVNAKATLRAIEAALSTPSPATAGVTVKSLEWANVAVDGGFPRYQAETLFGKRYEIFVAWWGVQSKYGYVFTDSDDGPFFHTADEAKAAAQSHFEAAILSAITLGTKDDRERIAVLARNYVAAVEHEPEKDCWDTETGKYEEGAEKFASDWSWKAHDDAKQKAFDDLRAALLTTDMGKEEGNV